MKKGFLALLLLACVSKSPAQTQTGQLNLASDTLTFCMSGNCEPLPDTSLFADPINNSIGNACIRQVKVSKLKHIPDLNRRLAMLQRGNAIVITSGRCSLSFPVIAGRHREHLRKIAEQAAIRLRPQTEGIIQRLHTAIPQRPELAFHFLWSRVMDEIWEREWETEFGHSPLPDAAWAVSPQNPFTVGTYTHPLPGNGFLSLTLSPGSGRYKNAVVSLSPDLYRLAWGRTIPTENEAQLGEFGLLDSANAFRVFTYRKGDKFDQLLDQFTSEYAAALAAVCDYKKIAKSFGLTPRQMFLILNHETAYALLIDLQRTGGIQIPTGLTSQLEPKEMVTLMSIRIADPE